MSGTVLDRVLGVFLVPVAAPEAPALDVRPHTAAVTAVAVLGGPPGAAVAVGLVLARRSRSGCVLVCRWSGIDEEPSVPGLAVPAARALAGRLHARGVAVAARGRAVTLALPAEPAAASAALQRAMAPAADVPVVLALDGARPTELDPVLATLDRLLVCPRRDAPAGLERLAVADAARVGRATGVLRIAAGGGLRVAAATGLVLTAGARSAVQAALDGHEA
jgi:hypothetical protein